MVSLRHIIKKKGIKVQRLCKSRVWERSMGSERGKDLGLAAFLGCSWGNVFALCCKTRKTSKNKRKRKKKLNRNTTLSFSGQKYSSKSAPTFPQRSPAPGDQPSCQEDVGCCWGMLELDTEVVAAIKEERSLGQRVALPPRITSECILSHSLSGIATLQVPQIFFFSESLQVLHPHLQPRGAVLSPEPAETPLNSDAKFACQEVCPSNPIRSANKRHHHRPCPFPPHHFKTTVF